MTGLNNTWSKRTAVILECPSGSVCEVMRPGPALTLRVARLQRTLQPLLEASKADGEGQALEEMAEETERATLAAAREVVAAAVVRPRLYLDPDPEDPEQIGVDDIDPRDFWHIFKWATNGARGVPVRLKGGESTTVEAVESFPVEPESGVGGGDHGGDVPEPQPEPKAKARRRRAAGGRG